MKILLNPERKKEVVSEGMNEKKIVKKKVWKVNFIFILILYEISISIFVTVKCDDWD